MEHKLMERVPQDLWHVIAKRLSQKDRSSARAASRFFFKRFTPEWDRYCHKRRKISAIVAGMSHSLLLTETGELFGCGSNKDGQLSLGPTQQQASWRKLSDKTDIRAIAAGNNHSLLLTGTGELFGCGCNQGGQLGLGHNKNQANWRKLSDKTDIRAIAADNNHSLLLTATGELFGCGNNYFGQLGLGQSKERMSWIKLSDKTNIRAIAVSWSHSLLVTGMGELFGCGNNQCGQLGLGHTQQQASWIKLSNKTDIRTIAVGRNHSLLLTETGELFGCGSTHAYAQLGLGLIENQASWIKLSDKTNINAIAAGWAHNLLLTETGELFGRGFNGSGQLGFGPTKTQASWVKLNPFPKSPPLSFEDLVQQRHFAFLSVSLKTLLKQCDALFQQLHAEGNKAEQQALFSKMKSSLNAQLTEPLPAGWDLEFKQLDLAEFRAFYHRLREYFKLAPAEDSSSFNRLTL